MVRIWIYGFNVRRSIILNTFELLDESFIIYPNSANTILNIKKPPYSNDNKTRVIIYDLNGVTIEKKMLSVSDNSLVQTIDISHYKHAMYLINIVYEDSQYYAKFLKID